MMNTLVPPPVVVLMVGMAMYFVDRQLLPGHIESTWRTPVAIALLVAGLLVMLVAAGAFFAAKTTINPMRPNRASHLITTGIYRLSRNPIYLADLLILGAWAVWLGSVVNVIPLGVFVWYTQRFQIAPEERALTELFGESYRAYCARVRRWL